MFVLDASPLGPLQLNATFLIETIAFLILLAVLGRWAYPLVIAAAEARQNQIRQQLDSAEKARHEAEERRREADAEIQQARTQAGQIIERANRAAERIHQEAEQKAREEAKRIVEAASHDIEAQRQRAIASIRQQMADLVGAAVARIVGQSLDGQRHRELIETAIEQVEREPSATS